MNIERLYTTAASSVEDQIAWKTVSVLIKDKDGKILCNVPNLEVPEHWSQSAAEILAHKYLRKAGVPSATHPDPTYAPFVPPWLTPRVEADTVTYGSETSARQVFRRLAGHWTFTGWRAGYFGLDEDGEDNAQAFYDEIFYMLAMQIAAPNSPQWFNTGLWWAYGISGKAGEGGWRSPIVGAPAVLQEFPYTYPQTSACFILGLEDSLLGESGILQTVEREARIFKYGSGSGINYSALRAKGAPLSNGGVSSGLMSFLKLYDTNAGAIKSGGTTRRAARMVIVDCDHPEAEEFVTWKAREEVKVAAMVAGAKGSTAASPLGKEVLKSLQAAEYEGEAYSTVAGQNANNTLRVTDRFMDSIIATDDDHPQTDANPRNKALWEKTISAAHACGDPGLQFHDAINSWHTIPKAGVQRATNPCSEYSFIDNSSCNLASLNLVKFWRQSLDDTYYFDARHFAHAARLWTIVLDISVGMSSYPDAKIAENSAGYRAIGLGYANLGGLLMLSGVGYGTEEGRTYAGLVTALMHGVAWETSAELALALTAFKDFEIHAVDVERVRLRHALAAGALAGGSTASAIGHGHPFSLALGHVEEVWRRHTPGAPIRNAQLTLLAPTGTIGLVMDCATTGVEPDFSLIKSKKLAGGGSMSLVNPLVHDALSALGYTDAQAPDITAYISQTGRVDIGCPHIKREHIAVFDCAGDIHWKDHIGMMAAVQPFLSGAISKTVNMESTATVEDISAAYMLAWKSGLKAVAVYRDGCKLSQPLTAVRTSVATNQPSAPDVSPAGPADSELSGVRVTTLPGHKTPTPRYKLPARRNGFTQKVRIAGQTLYMRTGEYENGQLGEVFLNFGRDGSTMRHLLDSLAVVISIGLQHGVPLQEFVEAFTDTRAEPSGMVQDGGAVRFCSSPMDYIVRELAAAYSDKEPMPMPDRVGAPASTSEAPPAPTPVVIVNEVYTSISDTIRADGFQPLPDGVPGNGSIPVRIVGGTDIAVTTLLPGMRTMAAPRYNGNACPICQAMTLRRSGSCHVCDSCGNTTGCS